MKSKLLNSEKEIELPKCFSSLIRADISQKVYEIEKKYQPFAPFLWAGMNRSASGKIKRARKVWKTGYGHGISRIPRKAFWRRGNQFYWRGAIVVSTVGGRRAHPPKVEHFNKELKINKKEKNLAYCSAISATASLDYLKKRYSSIDKINIHLPIVIDSSIIKEKAGKLLEFFAKNMNEAKNIIFQEKISRAGKGKMKLGGRKSAGLLLVIGNEENCRAKGIDIKKVSELKISDLWPLGRLAVYTEKAIKELGEKLA